MGMHARMPIIYWVFLLLPFLLVTKTLLGQTQLPNLQNVPVWFKQLPVPPSNPSISACSSKQERAMAARSGGSETSGYGLRCIGLFSNLWFLFADFFGRYKGPLKRQGVIVKNDKKRSSMLNQP